MKNKKPVARKVVLSLPPGIAHRRGVTHCPHRDFKDEEYDVWHAAAIMLVTEIVHGKHGSLAVVAECPKCFKKSWVHEGSSAFRVYEYYKQWTEIAEKVFAARHLVALRRFTDSLCATCVHLRKLECDTLPIIDCTYGKDENAELPPGRTFYMHHCFTTQKCEVYKKREPIIDTGA